LDLILTLAGKVHVHAGKAPPPPYKLTSRQHDTDVTPAIAHLLRSKYGPGHGAYGEAYAGPMEKHLSVYHGYHVRKRTMYGAIYPLHVHICNQYVCRII